MNNAITDNLGLKVDPYFETLFEQAVRLRASDVHLVSGKAPSFRIDGVVCKDSERFPALPRDQTEQALMGLLSQSQRQRLIRNMELDIGYRYDYGDDWVRFRINFHYQRFGLAAVLRVIPKKIPRPEEIQLEPSVVRLRDLPGGLVLITGATGMGKSTTVASIVDAINKRYPKHILTIEDPIEYYLEEECSRVTQRELDTHSRSFASALRAALRAHPDILMVGEMRDLETIQLALTASETGHLVFSTLHTPDVAQSLHRIVDVFPAFQQDLVRVQLASCLQAVVGQSLLPKMEGEGRVAAREILLASPAIRTHIRDGAIHQIYPTLCASVEQGMCPLELSLARLVRSGQVDYSCALARANHRSTFESFLEAN